MLKKHKNGFIDIINKAGLDQSLFTAKEENTEEGHSKFTLLLNRSPLMFEVTVSDGSLFNFYYRISRLNPHYTMTSVYTNNGAGYSIEDIYNAFAQWINKVVKIYLDDLLEPDLWNHIQQSVSNNDGSNEFDDKAPFTENEKAQIKLSISEFRALVITNIELSDDEKSILDDRLNYLKTGIDRLNKFDWKGLALQTLISISIALSFDSEKSRLLIDLFKKVFSSVVHLLN